MSRCLDVRGIDHLVLERDVVASSWKRHRWDTFSLVTPNWQCDLPDFPYAGPDPHGFMVRSEIVDYLEAYRAFVDPPLIEGVEVRRVHQDERGPSSSRPPPGRAPRTRSSSPPAGTTRRSPRRCPSRCRPTSRRSGPRTTATPASCRRGGAGGRVRQSGAQIAEDLHLAGRTVHLVVGHAPRVARFYRGRDVTDWLDEMGYYRMPVTRHPRREAVRAQANHYVTGRDGGRDIDLRRFATEGMRLYGALTDHAAGRLTFAPDLESSLDHADEVSESIKDTIDGWIADKGIDAPVEERYTPVWRPEREVTELALADAGITSVVWCIGFRQDFSWVDLGVFTGRGSPVHSRGVTGVPGLFFLGLPWQWTWGSGRFSGVGADAAFLAERIRSQRGLTSTGGRGDVCNVLALGS